MHRFGAQSVKRVINWLKTKEIDINSEIIDIGTGNGFTCFKLVNYERLSLLRDFFSNSIFKIFNRQNQVTLTY